MFWLDMCKNYIINFERKICFDKNSDQTFNMSFSLGRYKVIILNLNLFLITYKQYFKQQRNNNITKRNLEKKT